MASGKTLTEFERGYVSGIIDGEGWVGVSCSGTPFKKYPFYKQCSPRVEIAMADEKTIKHIANLCGTKHFVSWKNWRDSKGAKQKHEQWKICLTTNHILNLFPQLTFITKRRQAEVIYEMVALKRWIREFNFSSRKDCGDMMWKIIHNRLDQLTERVKAYNSYNWGEVA